MIPDPDWNYPVLFSEMALADKKAKAEELFCHYNQMTHKPMAFQQVCKEIMGFCQGDFKLSSLLTYKIVQEWYKNNDAQATLTWLFDSDAVLLPIRYCGGDMCFGRVFSINHYAFSSPDSIIGFRDAETDSPQQQFKVAKGLKYIGTYKNWVLFKLDKASTDDMTGVLFSPLEKNFTIEFAHFPHDGEKRILFRWVDC